MNSVSVLFPGVIFIPKDATTGWMVFPLNQVMDGWVDFT
jgi:hypothetical protein